MTPTINQLMKCYKIISHAERVKTGRPGGETVANALRGTRTVCAAAGVDLDSGVDTLTRKAFDEALAVFMQRGMTRITAWTYVCQLRAVFARWCRPYYKDAGWDVPVLELPVFRAQAPRYVRPCADMIKRVKAWYEGLEGELWFVATMMLEFAMRNGDVLRLTKENFITREVEVETHGGDFGTQVAIATRNKRPKDDVATTVAALPTPQSSFGQLASETPDAPNAGKAFFDCGVGATDDDNSIRAPSIAAPAGCPSGNGYVVATSENASLCVSRSDLRSKQTITKHFLSYVPHKTALTSGRRVFWPIHARIWRQLDEMGGLDGIDVTDETFTELNKEVRSLGFRGNKAAYELRKICIDHIYQEYGAEKASAISGDDIKTITHYYADPAQPNIGEVRVLDLL